MLLFVAVAIQAVHAPTRSAHGAWDDVPGHALSAPLLAELLTPQAGDRDDPDSETRDVRRGPGLAASICGLDLRVDPQHARHHLHRLPLMTERQSVHAPRAPPVMDC